MSIDNDTIWKTIRNIVTGGMRHVCVFPTYQPKDCTREGVYSPSHIWDCNDPNVKVFSENKCISIFYIYYISLRHLLSSVFPELSP